MLGIPELGCDENVLALETGNLAAESLLQRSCNLLLVAVDLGEIQVAVASLEGLKNGGTNLARLSLPSTKAQLTEGNELADIKCTWGFVWVLTGWQRQCSK